ncbi:MAG: alkaline phosphatase family protein, partial [Acetobacteraceae bacterium]
LALEGRTDVEGVRADPGWIARFTNADGGQSYPPYRSDNPYTMPDKFDPPHEWANAADNLGPPAGGAYPMNGFVSSIPANISADPAVRKLTMSYFLAADAPVSEFFAENFTICDRWFSSLPAGTQPNRLMAMAGFSNIAHNQTPLPDQELVYDWLNQRNVSWCVYHQGIPFFTMMPRWIPEILGSSHFRRFEAFAGDLMNNPPDELPQVIFIEPTYGDAPHLGRSTDDHAPSGIADGQDFQNQVYNAIAENPAFWQQCLLIIDYDEHGGFFDHVSPQRIATAAPPGVTYPTTFQSLGVRTPGFVISPFVQRRSVCHEVFDHTSVLKLLGEKFDPRGSYSTVVDARPVRSLSAALSFDAPITDPPVAPSLDAYLARRPPPPAQATVPPPNTALQQEFFRATAELRQRGADPSHPKFGKLMGQVFPNGAPGTTPPAP